MAVDAVTHEVVAGLQGAGVPCVVLKGPSLAAWLYPDARRAYVDSDVLVPAGSVATARGVLVGAGFEPGHDAPGRQSEVSQPWWRRRDGRAVDLHVSLHGATEAPDRVWELLGPHIEPLTLDGRMVPALDAPARTLLVALHAQQHADRPGGKPTEDLRRALERVADATWEQAAALALALGAERSFAEGLLLAERGDALLERLALGRALARGRTRPLAVARLRVASAPPGRRVQTLRGLLLPAPGTMRWRSSLARRGRRGLAAAYVQRVLRRHRADRRARP